MREEEYKMRKSGNRRRVMSFEEINKSKFRIIEIVNSQHTSAQMNKTKTSVTQVAAVAQPIFSQKGGIR